MITKHSARAYRKRWNLVERIKAEELRRMPVTEKFRQMDACYRMAVGLGLTRKLAAAKRKGEKEVRARWRRLKSILA